MKPLARPTILITAGGTGGHVMPAVVVAEEIISRNERVLFVTDPRGKTYIPSDFSGKLYILSLPLSVGSFISKIKLAAGLIKSLVQVYKILKKNRVRTIIGFGGYPSFPVLFLGLIYRVPFVLHEQNAVLGRVNRWFGRWSKALAISTSAIRPLNRALSPKIHLTGMPVRKEIQKLRRQNYVMPDKEKTPVRLTVLGGSQGSKIFSHVLPKAVALLPKPLQKRLSVTQQCRPNLLDKTQKAYDQLEVKSNLAAFFETIPEILKTSHIVIARAGASTIAELTWAQRPAILVPYSQAMDDHQKANAQEIELTGGGWMILESEFTPERLAKKLESLINHPQTLLFAAERLRALCRTDAEKILADMA